MWALAPGPFVARAADDNEDDEIPAVQGSIDVYTGQIELEARKFTAGLADVLIVEAFPTERAGLDGMPAIEPGTYPVV